MSAAIVLLGSAVVPSLFLLWYFYSRDERPEPRGLVFQTFLLGAFICLPVIPVAMGLERLGAGGPLSQAFLGAAIPEELFKFFVLRWVSRKAAFDEPMDGMVYGATASLGFATLENVFYVASDGGLGIAALRAFTAVPGHAFTGVIMGAYAGMAKFGPERDRAAKWRAGLLAAVALHGLYDAFLFTQSAAALLALGVLAFELRWSRRLVLRLQAEQRVGGLQVLDTVLLGASPRRRLWSWAKLALGALATTAGLIFLAALGGAYLVERPEGSAQVGYVVVATFTALATLGGVLLFRSGLGGPYTQPRTSPEPVAG